MFRRRPRRRRPLRRPGGPLRPGPQQALRRAHHLMEEGEYEASAEIFERLAKGAEQRGMLRRAPHLFLQAARALRKALQYDRAEILLYHGLNLLADANNWDLLHRVSATALQEVQQAGQTERADKLKHWLDEILKDHPLDEQETAFFGAPAQTKLRLPAKCPSCGASVKPNEVEWLDQSTAECLYCGSSLQAER